MNLANLPNVLHAQAISFFISLSEDCLVRSTNHEDCQYEVSCTSLLSLKFFIVKSPVTHHYIACFSL